MTKRKQKKFLPSGESMIMNAERSTARAAEIARHVMTDGDLFPKGETKKKGKAGKKAQTFGAELLARTQQQFDEALQHALKMEDQTAHSWDAVARTRKRLLSLRRQQNGGTENAD